MADKKLPQDNKRLEVVQAAVRVARKYQDHQDAKSLKTALPAIALAMYQSGLAVDEDGLSDLVERNKGNIKRLLHTFKTKAAPPEPEKDFHAIRAQIMKPFERAKECVEKGDIENLDNLIQFYGYGVFSKKVINDLVYHSIDCNQWKPIECLLKKHNYRFEDNSHKIVQRIYGSDQLDMFVNFYEYFKDNKNKITQEYLKQFIFHAYYALLDIDKLPTAYRYVKVPVSVKGYDGESEWQFLVQTLKSYLKEKNPEFHLDYGLLLFSRMKKNLLQQSRLLPSRDAKNLEEYVQVYFKEFLSLADIKDPKQLAEKSFLNYLFHDLNPESKKRKKHAFDSDIWGEYILDLVSVILKQEKKEEIKDQDIDEVRKEIFNKYFTEVKVHLLTLITQYVRAMSPEQIEGLKDLGESGVELYNQARTDLLHYYVCGAIGNKKSNRIKINVKDFNALFSKNPVTWEEFDDLANSDIGQFEELIKSKLEPEEESLAVFKGIKGRIKKLISHLDFAEIQDNENLKCRILLLCVLKQDTESFNYIFDNVTVSPEILIDLYGFSFHSAAYLANKANHFRIREEDKGILDAIEKRAKSMGLSPNLFVLLNHNKIGDCFHLERFARYHDISILDTRNNTALHLSAVINGRFDLLQQIGKLDKMFNYPRLVIEFIKNPSKSHKDILVKAFNMVEHAESDVLLLLHTMVEDTLLDEIKTLEDWNNLKEFGVIEVIQAFEERMTKNGIEFKSYLPSRIEEFVAKLEKKEEKWKKIREENDNIAESISEFSPYLFEKELYFYIQHYLIEEFKACLEENNRFPNIGLIAKRDVTDALSKEQMKDGYVLSDKEIIEIVGRGAYGLAEIFQDKKSFLDYIEKWGKPSTDILWYNSQELSIIYSEKTLQFNPEIETYRYSEEKMDRKAWKDAILQCGPRMMGLRKYAAFLPKPSRSDDNRTYSISNTIEDLSKKVFLDTSSSVEARDDIAKLCLRFGFDSDVFDKAIVMEEKRKRFHDKKNDDDTEYYTHVPFITLDGNDFDIPGAKFYKLDDGDVRGMFLGNFVDCCQSIAGHDGAQKVVKHGYVSSYGGFYVVEKEKEIIGAVWAWVDKTGTLVFDSLETLGGRVKPESWEKICTLCSNHLEKHSYVVDYIEKVKKESDAEEENLEGIEVIVTDEKEIMKQVIIDALVVGQGGDTPDLPFPNHEENLDPIDAEPYDSDNRYLVWNRSRKHEKKLAL